MAAVYVQYGCGFSVGPDWLNFDNSPVLRLERLPLVGRTLGRLAGNAQPFPPAVHYGDICKGLPVADGSARGVYASHVLEHLSLDDFRRALRNTWRMLAPGGTFRLIVPDLQERARRYLRDAAGGDPQAAARFMRMGHLGIEHPRTRVRDRLRPLLGNSAHLWMWDEPALVWHLQQAGFVHVRRCAFGDSGDPMFDQVEDAERFVDGALGLEELALSAHRPGECAKARTGRGISTTRRAEQHAMSLTEARPSGA